MPRTPRVHLEGVIYYVTLEGPNQEEIFRDSQDHQKYLELLAQYKEEFKFKLFSYALLPHRLHLLIEVNDEFPISHVMQKITPLYTKYYNSRYQRKGPLFQKRFRSVIIEKESYLPQLTWFVHLAPVSAGLAQNPADYPHSSYRAFLTTQVSRDFETAPSAKTRTDPSLGGQGLSRSYGKKSIDGIASTSPGASERSLSLKGEVEEVLHMLDHQEQQDAYERYVLSACKEELELLGRRLSRGAFLGSDEFISQIKERAKDQSKKNHDVLENANVSAGFKPAPTFQVSRRLVTLSGLPVFAISLSAFSVYYNYQTMINSNAVILSEAKNLGDPSPHKERRIHPLAEAMPQDDTSRQIATSRPDLNGTIWEVELVSEEPDGTIKAIHDKIRFTGKSFESSYFTSQGFSRSNYTVTLNNNGVITWETIQRNDRGELVSWRGDWQGNKMEGVMSYRPVESQPQDFSFMSQQFGVQK